MPRFKGTRVLIYGGGELGTAVAHRFHSAGMAVAISELPQPLAVCRDISLAQAVYQGKITVDGLRGYRADGILQAEEILSRGHVPVLVDPIEAMIEHLAPQVMVDATRPRLPLPPFSLEAAPVSIALGQGRRIGREVKAVVETRPTLALGAVYYDEEPAAETELLPELHLVETLQAEIGGIFVAYSHIGEEVQAGQPLGVVGNHEILATADGFVRGLLADGVIIHRRDVVAELALAGGQDACFHVSPWARAVAGGALEAVARLLA